MYHLKIGKKLYKGTSVAIRDNTVVIDGKRIVNEAIPKDILTIEVKGTLVNLTTDSSVHCDDIAGDVQAGGSVNCDNVGGDVKAGGSVNCDNVGKSVYAGGSVSCD